jgi:multidrug efflux system membrane fusion protein
MRDGAPEVLAYVQGANVAPADMLARGTLAVLDNQVDPTTGTIKLKATFANPDNKLWPGGFVGIRLLVDVAKDATVVPSAAVQRGPHGSYVYVITDGDQVGRRPVVVGHEDDAASVITEGVQPGERVVIDGAARLTDGSRITIAEPAGSAQSSPASGAQASAPGAVQQPPRRPTD